jgi:enoyl-CoA hydratase
VHFVAAGVRWGETGIFDDTMPEEPVLIEDRGHIRIMTLNRPAKLNAADLAMQRSLLERWLAIAADERIRAVVLTGTGRAFCAGGDFSLLRELAAGNQTVSQELSRINRELLQCMLELDVPVIAAVNGPAVGFGADLLALCDVVVMAEGAFLSDPHVRYGIPASPACQLVWPYLTSRAVAKELLMSGRQVDAGEAARLGLVNRITAPGDEMAEALGIAQDLAALPASGVVAVKRAFNRPLAEQFRLDDRPPEPYRVVWEEGTMPGNRR